MRAASSTRRWVSLSIAFLVLLGGPLGTALAEHQDRDRREDIWHVHHSVNATVVDNYATVRVGVEIVNEGPDPEFPFRVELPEEAYVTGLTLTRDGETYEASIEPREQAREQYEQAKQEHRSAGLVSQQADDDVYAYDINVEGTETVEAVLTYEHYLAAEGGAYTLPLHAPATQRGVDEGVSFDVRLQHAGGLANVQASPEAEVVHQDGEVRVSREVDPRSHGEDSRLDVSYGVPETDPGGSLVATVEDGTGYFAHRFRAEDAGEDLPLDIALVLDKSGSMRGDKMTQLRSATRSLVDALDAEDRLHLTFFSDRTQTPWEGFRPVDGNRTDDAFQALERVRATGSTNIGAGIEDGFAPFEAVDSRPDRLPVVVFLTDGRPTTGITGTEELRMRALEANSARANVFSLAFGEDADWSLVHGLAEDGYGLAQRVQADAGAEVDLRSFLTALTSPVLTDVSIEHANASVTAWRVGAPVLFADGELLYVGTFDPGLDTLEAEVSARAANATRTWNVSAPIQDEGPSYIQDLAAYQRIRALEDRIDAQGGNQTLEDEALELALEHGFVTEQTSLVVDLPEQADEEQGSPEANDDASDATAADQGDAAQRSAPADADGDGLADDQDACPDAPGPDQGCPENDAHPDPEPSDGEEGSEETGHAPVEEPAETPAVGMAGLLIALAVVALLAGRRSG